MGSKGGGGGVKIKTSPLEKEQVEIARQQRGMAEQNFANAQALRSGYFEPMRGVIQPQLLQTLGYGSPFATTLSAPERGALEGQYNQAKQAIMNTAERGGRLRSQMAGLERDRASSIAQASNEARQRGIGRALQFAGGAMPNYSNLMGGEQQAMSGLSSSASGLGSALASAQKRALAEAEMKAKGEGSKGGGIGSLIGGIGGSFFGPLGTMAGSALGGMLGNAVGGGGGGGGGGSYSPLGSGFDAYEQYLWR